MLSVNFNIFILLKFRLDIKKNFLESKLLLSIQNIPMRSEMFACNSPAAIVFDIFGILSIKVSELLVIRVGLFIRG